MRFPIRKTIAGLAIAVAATAGYLAVGIGIASAHDLTGGSGQATCDAGTVKVAWTFTSSNAGQFHIVTVAFNRPVLTSGFTADTVTATTAEQPGTASLKATVTFNDGFQSSHTVRTTIPDAVCPPATTTPPTTTAPQPTTTQPTFPVPPPEITSPPTTTAPDCVTGQHPVNPPADFTCVLDATPVFHDTPTSVVQTTTTAAGALPATGSTPVAPLAVAVALLVIGALLIASRRIPDAR